MIRNLMLYPAELRGRGGFPRVSGLARQGLRGTEGKQAAQEGAKMPQNRAHWSERKTVDPVSGCWNWTGGLSQNGYGKACGTYVHRLSYAVAKGSIPPGTEIDHLCRNRRCFNPDHLEAVTHQENVQRSPFTRTATHCRHGHPFAKFGFWLDGGGRKRCKECRRLRERPEFRPVDYQEIRRLRADGLKGRQIAELTGVSMRTIWRALAA